MKINIDKETIKTVGVAAGKIGKAIVIEGIKGVLLKTAAKAITTSFEDGLAGVKKLTVDDYIGAKKRKPFIEFKSKQKDKPKTVVDADFEIVNERDEA